jgi:hypothetical protein
MSTYILDTLSDKELSDLMIRIADIQLHRKRAFEDKVTAACDHTWKWVGEGRHGRDAGVRYYSCTHPNCVASKEDGPYGETIYHRYTKL